MNTPADGTPPFATAEAAETAFYRAFMQRDLEAMMAVWAAEDDISCVHPQGARLAGIAAVRASWQAIFSHSAQLEFTIAALESFHDATLAVHVVHEHISVGGNVPAQSPVTATNVYCLRDGGWRMVVHHASPGPAVRAASTLH